jgi:hypothetical protein
METGLRRGEIALLTAATVAAGGTWVLTFWSVFPKFVSPIVASVAAALYLVEIVRLKLQKPPDLDALERQRCRIEQWALDQAGRVRPNAGVLEMDSYEARAFALHYSAENGCVAAYLRALENRTSLWPKVHEAAVRHSDGWGERSEVIADLLEWAANALYSGDDLYADAATQVMPHDGRYYLMVKTTQHRDILGAQAPMERSIADSAIEDELTDIRDLLRGVVRAVGEWDIWPKIRESDDAVNTTAIAARAALASVHSLVKINCVAQCPMCRGL